MGWDRRSLKIVFVTSNNDEVLHQTSILKLCEAPLIYKFSVQELELKKKLPRIDFIRSRNNFKTLVWLLFDNPVYAGKNIYVYTQKFKTKLE